MIKKLETLQELPRFDTETEREQMLSEKNEANRFAWQRVTTNRPVSTKWDKAKHNKMSCACNIALKMFWFISILLKILRTYVL